MRYVTRRVAALAACLLLAGPALAAQDSTGVAPVAIVSAARIGWSRWPDFGRYVDLLSRLYAADTPIWFAGAALGPAGRSAIGELLAASEHGLDPRDYDAFILDSLARASDRAPLPGTDRVRFDVLLSLGLVRYLDDLQRGRMHPPTLGHTPAERPDLASGVAAAIGADSVPRLVTASAPQLGQYRRLQRLLHRYRQLAADASLAPIPLRVTVRPDRSFAGLAALAHRLVAVGDLPVEAFPPEGDSAYSGALVTAVRRFQQRHGLEQDGVLGPATIAALNTPFSHRVREIELALERLRWLPPIGRQPFIVVNIPQFELIAFDSTGETAPPTVNMRVIVGKALRTRTPVMLEQMRYLEFRPYWNVPRSILVNEIVPILRRNPNYLQSNDMEMVGPGDLPAGDRPGGDAIGRLLRGELRVRQRPGPENSLGLIKFVFPNASNVYLHGTPHLQLFERTRRDFSHGCIRLERPEALAVWLLRDQPGWNLDRVRSAMSADTSSRSMLSHPVPVVIFYTTAVVRSDGSAWFYADIYGHDRELDEALRAGPTSP
jgi:murein L,D-transpeptidase YcbB/YkuD